LTKLATDKPGDEPIIWQWMNKRTRLPWSSDLRCIAAVRDDGTIASAVAYNAWTLSSCWMHVAFDNEHSLTRGLWRAAFEYPFVTCGKEAVYGLTPKHLEDAVRMNRKLGFREIAETVDCVMFEMKADECRWLKGVKDGRQRISTSSA
jgi:hypothetical protein